jgi:hypothetical protein
MAEATIVGAVRGQDSTGAMQVDKPGTASKLYFYKDAVVGNEFLQNKQAVAIIDDAHNAFITTVHHRAATAGKVSAENAHPFSFWTSEPEKALIAVHNGTLRNWFTKEDNINFAVDSEWAIWRMARDGVVPTLEKLEGAFAFAIYDQRDPDDLQLITNGERPMHFAFVAGKKTMLYGSEPEMLAWLAKRNRLSLENNTIYKCLDNVLYKFPYSNPREYSRTEVKTRPKSYGGSYGSDYFIGEPTYRRRTNRNAVQTRDTTRNRLAEIMKEVLEGPKENAGTPAETESQNGVQRNDEGVLPGVNIVNTTDRFREGFTRVSEIDALNNELDIPTGSEALFEITAYSKEDGLLRGNVLVKTKNPITGNMHWESFIGLIRNVKQSEYDKYTEVPRSATFNCRAVGAVILKKDSSGNPIDSRVICSGLEHKFARN